MSIEGDTTTEETRGRVLPIPFSSRGMKAEWLRQMAKALEVPATAGVSDLRLMLEGKLIEMDRQPANVQAYVDLLVDRDSSSVTKMACSWK